MATAGILKVCTLLYLVLILADLVRTRRYLRFLLELLPLIGLLLIDVLVATSTRGFLAFGPGTPPTTVILVMFGAILLGIIARYVFYFQGNFSWLDFAKPLCISPILILPLIGSVQGLTDLEPTQVISFALLAFQNGFFWQVVLAQAHPKT